MRSTVIIGCNGYSGQETLDRVLGHPELELVALGSDSLAGEPASALDVRLNGSLPPFVTNEVALAAGAELVFLCLGHEDAAAVDLPPGAVVVDLSGAHRLRDPALYAEWYGFEHPRPETLGGWSYSVPELWQPEGPLVANPGCYATAALLALAPLADALDPGSVVVDAKSGVSGAGRGLTASSHAGFVLENLSAYKVGAHQHAPEMAQALGFPVCFVPHLLPIRRGLLVTCYASVREDAGGTSRVPGTLSTGPPTRTGGFAAALRQRLEAAYAAAPAVRVLPDGATPELSRVQGTDAAEIALYEDRPTGRAIIACAIDNLGKGAAGQAVQNANLALGLDETLGLRLQGVLV